MHIIIKDQSHNPALENNIFGKAVGLWRGRRWWWSRWTFCRASVHGDSASVCCFGNCQVVADIIILHSSHTIIRFQPRMAAQDITLGMVPYLGTSPSLGGPAMKFSLALKGMLGATHSQGRAIRAELSLLPRLGQSVFTNICKQWLWANV